MTGAPLAGVHVEAMDPPASTVTNQAGAYALSAGFSGRQRLRFSRPQYDSIAVEIIVPAGHSLRLDVELQPVPVPLPAIEISATVTSGGSSQARAPGTEEIGLRRFTPESMRADPLDVDRDPILAIARAPGAGAQGGFPSTLHIRGGSSDQNLILLDGVPVYGAMHLGGVASIFNPDAIGSVELRSAVLPASVSGRLSSAINVEIRSDAIARQTMSGAWNPMSMRQMVDIPFDRRQGSLLLSGRRSYRGIFAADPGDGEKANRFEDFLLRSSYHRGRDHLSIYVVESDDRLAFPALAQTANNQGQYIDTVFNRFQWSSNTEALVWRHAVSEEHQLTIRAWHAGAGAAVAWSANAESRRVTSALNETGVRVEFQRTRPESHRVVGVELRHLDVAYDVTAGSSSLDTAATFQPVHLSSGPTIGGAFIEEQRHISPRWSLVAGLHASYLARVGAGLEPRLTVRYNLISGTSLSLGYARLYQYVQSLRNEESLIDRLFGADLPVAVGAAGLLPARSDQVSAALDARLNAHSTLRLNSYIRSFRNLAAVSAVTVAPFADRMTPTGRGHAEGVELEFTHHSSRINLRSVAGGGTTVRESGSTEFSPGTQQSSWVVLGVGYRLDDLTTLRATTSWGAGSPTTRLGANIDWEPSGVSGLGGEISGSPEAIPGSVNRSRLPDYYRTDLGIERRWEVRILGGPGILTSSLFLNNLFNRRNVLGLLTEPGSSSFRTISYPPRSLGLQIGWEF